MSLSVPSWFQQATNTPFSSHTINVENCDIVYQHWENTGNKPGLVLVHGNGAHAGWWNFIAPSFLDRFDIAAVNLSGMGDSGHRDIYTADLFVQEVLSVSRAVGLDSPLLLGHSFGGRLAFHTMKAHADYFTGVIMADSPFHNETHLKRFHTRRTEAKPNKTYPSKEDALARFRLSPEQPAAADYIMDYIGRRSLKEVEGGWTWKFDPRIWAEFDYLGFMAVLPEVGDNILSMIYGEHSVLFEQGNLDYNQQLFAKNGLPELICMKDAYHHLLLDKPQEFITIIDALLNQYLQNRL